MLTDLAVLINDGVTTDATKAFAAETTKAFVADTTTYNFAAFTIM